MTAPPSKGDSATACAWCGGEHRMTPARVEIAAAVHHHGMKVEAIEYSAREGWTVFVKDHGVATGWSWLEVVESIDMLAPGWLNGTIFG